MGGFFNPLSAKYRRGVFVSSVYACTILSYFMVTADWGSQVHVFTPLQAYINQKGDKFFNVTQDELNGKVVPKPASKPIFTMRRIDIDKDGNEKKE